MRGLVKLLLGDEMSEVLDRFAGNGGEDPGWAGPGRRSGEWCGTTPGRGAVADVLRDPARPRRIRRAAVIRDLRC